MCQAFYLCMCVSSTLKHYVNSFNSGNSINSFPFNIYTVGSQVTENTGSSDSKESTCNAGDTS